MSRFWTDHKVRSWILIGLIGVAAAVQIRLIQRQSLWVDEVFSLAMATGHSLEHPAANADPARGDFVEGTSPLPATVWRRYLTHEDPPASPARVVRAVFLSDTSPPLYYLLLWGWTRIFGATDVTLRLWSVLCGLACLPLLMGIARRVAPANAAVTSAVLFTFSPPAVYYLGEGRMYSLLWICVVAAALVTLLIAERGGAGWQLLWVVISAAGFLVHYFFLFPWLAMVAFQALQPGCDRRILLVVRGAAVGLLILPWYLNVPASLANWRITGNWLKLAPPDFSRWSAARDLALQFFSGRTLSLWTTPWWAEAIALLALAIAAVVGLARIRCRIFAGPRLLIWLWLVAAWAGPLAIDAVQGTYTAAVSRYAIAALPAACLLMAGALAAVGDRWRLALLVVLVGAWSASLRDIARTRFRSGLPMREIARVVSARATADDLVLVHSIPSGVLGLAYYARGDVQIASWVGQLGSRHVPSSLAQLAANRKRIVFARLHDVGEPAPEEEWLRANARVESEKKLNAAVVISFLPKSGPTF